MIKFYFGLIFFVVFVQVAKTAFQDDHFGDIGEEHDLDDLINKRFFIPKEESKLNTPAVNSTGETATTTDLLNRDVTATAMRTKEAGTEVNKSEVNSTVLPETITDSTNKDAARTANTPINDNNPDSLIGVLDDDFVHEITMKSPDSIDRRHYTSNDTEGQDVLNSNSEDQETLNGLDQGSAFSGSGDLEMDHENPISKFSDSDFTNLTTSDTELSNQPIKKAVINHKPMTDEDIQALSALNKILDPSHAHIRNSIPPSDLRDRQIATEKAVKFAKFLRGASQHKPLASKRDFIPSFPSLKQPVINDATDVFEPMKLAANFKRNTITIPFRIIKPPDLGQIFKRDRIQIHRNLKKLAEEHKENTLLNDLSNVAMQWTGYKDDKHKNENPGWMRFLKRAMEPRLDSGDVGVNKEDFDVRERIRAQMTRDSRNRVGYVLNPSNSQRWLPGSNSNKIYKKVGSVYIKPYEIEQHLNAKKKQFSTSYPPYKPIMKPFVHTQLPVYAMPLAPKLFVQTGPQLFLQPGLQQSTFQFAKHVSDVPSIASTHDNQLNGVTKCLPENALCDTGRDEQCCGAASFCVDYWGVGKCLAFKKTSYLDHTNPFKMANNLNYKAYYNAMLGHVKNEIAANGYQKNVGDILKSASLSR